MKCWPIPTIIACLLASCASEVQNTIILSGSAQGTTYNITYVAGAYANYRVAIDSIFHNIDQSLSTWQTNSLISQINRNETNIIDAHFLAVFRKAKEVSEITNGLFDPTVAPLVQAYGFGFKKKDQVTPALIDSLRRWVGYKNIGLQDNKLVKKHAQAMLDFNAIAPGYTVDVLAAFLESKDIEHYLIELGGEVLAKGNKLDGSSWILGIVQPNENQNDDTHLNTRIQLKNLALATSGNYKNFYIEDGKKYSHIIHPYTGLPARNSLLSATVTATDCMTADAYATACMVMGWQAAKQFIESHPELHISAYFIYDDEGTTKTYFSRNFPQLIP